MTTAADPGYSSSATSLRLILEHASTLKEAGDIVSAKIVLEEAATLYPTDIRPYIELASIFWRNWEYDLALIWLDKASNVYDANFWTYYIRGSILRVTGRTEESVAVFREGISKCSGKVTPQEHATLLKCLTEARSIAAWPDPIALTRQLTKQVAAGRPLDDSLQVSLVKDEEDIIYYSLSQSYKNGLRYFVIGDNNSSDGTKSEIKRFADEHDDCIVYLVDDPVAGYYQAAKTMGLARLGATIFDGMHKPISWVFPLDADEVIKCSQPGADLYSVLHSAAGQGANLLTYMFCNAGSGEAYEIVPQQSDIGALFPILEPFHHSLVRKVAYRNGPDAALEQGNHFCTGCASQEDEVIIGAEHGIVLLHYPVRSTSQLRKKVVNGGKALESFQGPAEFGAHWRRDYNLYLEGGDEYLRGKIRKYMKSLRFERL